jgi:hypothetical protein
MSSLASACSPSSHSSHIPYHERLRHLALLVGGVSVGVVVGNASVGGNVGGSVMVDDCDVVVSLIIVEVASLQPQNLPGVRQVVLVVDEDVDVVVV